jgi:hypothetical protein
MQLISALRILFLATTSGYRYMDGNGVNRYKSECGD